MKKLRFLTIVMLCVSLLAFTGCGGNNNNTGTDVNEGTVASEGTNVNDNNGNNNNNNNNDSVAGDMAEGVDRAANDMADGIDDVTDDLDGKGNSRDTNKDNSNEKTRNN